MIPPLPENPPSLPSLRITLWQGIISKSLFCPQTLPTYLGDVPTFFAISPYVETLPYLILDNSFQIFFCKEEPSKE